MPPHKREQRNPYVGEPRRAWIRITLHARERRVREIRVMVDTGSWTRSRRGNDRVTGGPGNKVTRCEHSAVLMPLVTLSPCHLVTLSPCHLVTLSPGHGRLSPNRRGYLAVPPVRTYP